jgi:hypothetical protein
MVRGQYNKSLKPTISPGDCSTAREDGKQGGGFVRPRIGPFAA